MSHVAEMREILRHWGVYGPCDPGGALWRFVGLPVDDLSDEAIVEIARQIAAGKAEEGDE